MNPIWFEEELLPPDNIDEIVRGLEPKGSELPKLPKGMIRHQMPQHRIILPDEKVSFRQAGYRYTLVKLGVELDPGEKAREQKFGFLSAKLTVFLLGNNNLNPRVYSLSPMEVNQGKPTPVKLKLEPSLKLISGAGASLGGVEAEIAVGQVAPVVRGFKGEGDCTPYWNLEHHREAPLYGTRNFWLLLEVPKAIDTCRLVPFLEAKMQSRFGPIPLSPKFKGISTRNHYTIKFE